MSTVVEIIEEIKQLPPDEQAQVAKFVRSLAAARGWTPAELTEAADRLAGEEEPARAQSMKEEIVKGFYGDAGA